MTTVDMLREYRIGGFTLFDSGLTLIAVLLLAPLLTRLFRKIGLEVSLVGWLLFTLPLSVVVHLATGQQTALVRQVTDPSGHYVAKIVVVVLLVVAIASVKKVKKT